MSLIDILFGKPLASWEDSEQKITRPRQVYTGARERDYVPVDQR